jgi:hypothetical protein
LFSISGAPVSRRRYVNIENLPEQEQNSFPTEQLLCRDHFCLESHTIIAEVRKRLGMVVQVTPHMSLSSPIPDFSPALKKPPAD